MRNTSAVKVEMKIRYNKGVSGDMELWRGKGRDA